MTHNEETKRNVTERCIGWLIENCSPATRHDKWAASSPALLHLTSIRQYLHLLAPVQPR